MFGEIKKLFAGLICASMIFSSAPAPTYAAKATKTKTVSKVKGKSTKKKSSKKKKTTSKSPTKQTSTNGAAPFHVTNLPANMLTIKKGKSKTISIKMNGKKMSKSTTLKKVKWSSSNKKIVTVTSKGKLKAKKKGKANVTIALKSNKKRKIVIAVTVGTPVSKVQLSQGSMVVTLHQSKSLTASVLPVNASNKGIIWRSKNNAIATVNNGIVYGVNKGSVGIEAIAADGSGRKATANITVADDNYSTQPSKPTPTPMPTPTTISPTGILMSETSVALNNGGSRTLTATITPSNASNKNIKWSSSNSSVVSVSGNNQYGYIYAHGSGNATITATSEANSAVSASTNVTVYSSSSDSSDTNDDTTINPTSIVIKDNDGNEYSYDNNVSMTKGESSKYFYATVYPSNATNKNLKWKSLDEDVVTVNDYNSYAYISPVGKGETTVKVTSNANDSVRATLDVTVTGGSISVYSQDELEDALENNYDTIYLEGSASYTIPEGDYSGTLLSVYSTGDITNYGLFSQITIYSGADFTEKTPSSLGNNYIVPCDSDFKNLTVSSDSHVGTVSVTSSANTLTISDHGSIDQITITDSNKTIILEGSNNDMPVTVNMNGYNDTFKSYLPIDVTCNNISTLYLLSSDTSDTNITATATGYVPTIYGTGSYDVRVTNTGTTQTVDAISTTTNSVVKGAVFDAVSESVLTGITAKLYRGSDHDQDSNYISTDTTDTSGKFSFQSLSSGSYTVWLEDERSDVSSDDRMISKSENFTVSDNGTAEKNNIFMSQKLTGNQIRYVLSWETSVDLDAHLYKKTGTESRTIAADYTSKTYTNNGMTIASLNVDSRGSSECESITIENPIDAETYSLYIKNNSSASYLMESKAKVEVYTSSGLRTTYTLPTTGSGSSWYVEDYECTNGYPYYTEMNKYADS